MGSSILNLQTLQSQFALTMDQYKQAYASYTSTISGSNTDPLLRKSYLAQIEELNTKLIDLNSQILNATKDLGTSNPSLPNLTQEKDNSLMQIYIKLLEEKGEINKILDEYALLDYSQDESTLRADTNYLYYRILIIISIIIFIFTLRLLISIPQSSNVMKGGGGGKSSFYDLVFNFILILLLLLLAQSFKNKAGYILWSLFVLSYVLIELNIFKKLK